MNQKDAFEAWYGEHYTTYLPKDDGGEYCNLDTLLAWKTWIASRRAALEEAAMAIEPRNSPDDWTDYAIIRAGAAATIRALAEGDKQ